MSAKSKKLPIVELQEVSKKYGFNQNETVAVNQLSLQAFPGEVLLFLGPSGSGKTTLLSLIAGLIKPSNGQVRLFGTDIRHYPVKELQKLRASNIGFIFQNFLLIDSLTVQENIAIVPRFSGSARSAANKVAARLLERLQIPHLCHKFPGCLSQGEKQRAAIARALANNADLILADEPTGSLESAQGFEIIQILTALARKENKCIIVSTHDRRLIDYADRIIHLKDGNLASVTGKKTGRGKLLFSKNNYREGDPCR